MIVAGTGFQGGRGGGCGYDAGGGGGGSAGPSGPGGDGEGDGTYDGGNGGTGYGAGGQGRVPITGLSALVVFRGRRWRWSLLRLRRSGGSKWRNYNHLHAGTYWIAFLESQYRHATCDAKQR